MSNTKQYINQIKRIEKLDEESLASYWENADWTQIENNLLEIQRTISKATYSHNDKIRKEWQMKLVCSLDAKMLAVRHVCESLASPGVDGVKWSTPIERMKAALSLTSKDYKASPMKLVVIQQKGSTKRRDIQIPTAYDRAMQTLYAYSLDPVSEATASKKSFAFRKGRSTQDVHAFIIKALSGKDAPRYVVKADVKACYASISHDWLLENIPMDKKVLLQFLKSGHVFAGELFPPDDCGISLGSTISPILGNIALDGMQAAIFEGLHGKSSGNIDYAEGNLIRFADDCLFTARTRASAARILEFLTEFLLPRGMKLSEEKTQIVDLNDGLDFLSHNYRLINGIVCSAPSKDAVARFEESLRDFILNYSGSQGSLITKLNKKLNGWATYHKITDARDEFRHIDVIVKAYLLRLCMKLHPYMPQKSLINKYFFMDYDGEYVYALPDKSDVRVIRLANVVFSEYKPVNLSKNPYLDDEYHESRSNEKEIQSVTGKYKAIWTRQNGKCYYCGKPILLDQRKSVVTMDVTHAPFSKNLAYIHAKCDSIDVQFVETSAPLESESDIQKVLEEIAEQKVERRGRLKYALLKHYFGTLSASRFTLTFAEIENIICEPLCPTAHKYVDYWYRRGFDKISECWFANGYKILNLDFGKKQVSFIRTADKVSIVLPSYLKERVPPNCKAEIDNFFGYMKAKYGL